MKSKLNFSSAFSGILILFLFCHAVSSSPLGVGERTEETTSSSLSDLATDQAGPTQLPQNARQDGDGEEETTSRAGENESGPSSSPASPASGSVDEDSDEEDTDSPAPTQAPLPPSTTLKPKLQLNSTFNNEWSIVVANQNKVKTQNQIPNEIPDQTPNPSQQPNEVVEPNENENENEKEEENEDQNQNQIENVEGRQETIPETDTEGGADADADAEDKDEDNEETTSRPKATSSTSTQKYSVIDEWAIVTGNVSATKDTKKSPSANKTKIVGKPTLDISSATFNSEWAAVNAVTGTGAGFDSSKPASDTESADGVSGAGTEKPDDDVENQTEKEKEAVASGSNNEIEEDDEEDKENQTQKPVVNVTSSTLKSTTFEKEWAIVTGEEVLSDPQARASCECGKVPFNVPGGGVNEWPWTAAIVRNGLFAGGRPHCGATLINNKYAITSAHCMDGLLPDRTELWLTVHDNLQNSGSSSGTLKLPVEKILMHPNYHRNSRDNDIALIGLVDPINIGDNHYFVPACVPAGTNNYQGVMGKMAAWSTAELGPFGNRVSNKLCRAEMPILSNDVCNRDTRHTGKITINMLCAGYLTPSIDSKCVGDAGGGLVIANGGRHTLIGVTSFGYTPNKSYSPTVHTRVSEYAEWILHNTRDADWCE